LIRALNIQRQKSTAELIIFVDEPTKQRQKSFLFTRIEGAEKNFVSASDVRLQVRQKSHPVCRNNRRALTPILGASRLTDKKC
jgi:hypothetical protein